VRFNWSSRKRSLLVTCGAQRTPMRKKRYRYILVPMRFEQYAGLVVVVE
jgi:hypothetical protein